MHAGIVVHLVTLPLLRPTLAEVWYAGKPEQVNWLIKINKMEMIYLSRWNLMDLDTLGEQSGSILLLDPGHDHAAATLLPVHWGGHLPGGGQLQAVHNPEDLIEVPAGGGRIENRQLEPPVWANHKYSPRVRKELFSLMVLVYLSYLQVRGIPLASFSSGSSMPYKFATSRLGSAMMG